MEKSKVSTRRLCITLALLISLVEVAHAECAGNGEDFVVKDGVNGCIQVGAGHKVVHCIVNGLQQNAYLLVTHTGFAAHSAFPIPSDPIFINQNQQRLVFMGYGLQKNTKIVFHYAGPWDPMSYQYNLVCTWTSS